MGVQNVIAEKINQSSPAAFSTIAGKIMLQVVSAKNIVNPSRKQEMDSGSTFPRMISLSLTDGHGKISAVEYSPVKKFTMESLVPGTKIILEDVMVFNQILLLKAENVKHILGEVSDLKESWMMKQDAEKSRLINTLESGDEPPPKFEKLVLQKNDSKTSSVKEPKHQNATAQNEPAPKDKKQVKKSNDHKAKSKNSLKSTHGTSKSDVHLDTLMKDKSVVHDSNDKKNKKLSAKSLEFIPKNSEVSSESHNMYYNAEDSGRNKKDKSASKKASCNNSEVQEAKNVPENLEIQTHRKTVSKKKKNPEKLKTEVITSVGKGTKNLKVKTAKFKEKTSDFDADSNTGANRNFDFGKMAKALDSTLVSKSQAERNDNINSKQGKNRKDKGTLRNLKSTSETVVKSNESPIVKNDPSSSASEIAVSKEKFKKPPKIRDVNAETKDSSHRAVYSRDRKYVKKTSTDHKTGDSKQ